MSEDIKIAISPESWNRVVRERDEAREEIRDWKRLHDAAERGVDLTIAEGTISDLRKQRDEWSAMCSRYKQERDIAEQDATNYHARIIELIAERDKTKQERDEAREIIKIVAQDKDKIIEQLIVERDSAREIYKTLHSLYADEIVKNRNI